MRSQHHPGLCTRPLSIPKWTLKTYGSGQVGNSPGKLTMPIKCATEDCMKRALFMRCDLAWLDTLCTNVSLSIHISDQDYHGSIAGSDYFLTLV